MPDEFENFKILQALFSTTHTEKICSLLYCESFNLITEKNFKVYVRPEIENKDIGFTARWYVFRTSFENFEKY